LSIELYERQMKLAEVGESGQLLIGRASFSVAADASGEIEIEYLRRAGAGAEIASDSGADAFAHAGEFRFAASRQVAEGAWRALAKLRGVVL